MKSIEIVPIRTQFAKGEYGTKLYKGTKRQGWASDFEDIVVLAPGWLGDSTLDFAARSLARRGHDVAVVSHRRTSVLHPNQDRSKHVHFTARAATQATGKRGVVLIGHSNGNQDTHHAAVEALRRQAGQADNKDLYRIKAIGSIAGAGLSGSQINPTEMPGEIIKMIKHLAANPAEDLDVVMRSLWNLYRHPILAPVEGIGAFKCDVRPQAREIMRDSSLRTYAEAYLDNDRIIPLPQDRTDFLKLPGMHLTPVTSEEVITGFAGLLYEPNQPASLQLAQAA